MKKTFLINKFFTGSLVLLASTLPRSLVSCSCSEKKNPHKELISEDVIQTVESIKRLDADGHLYFMENSENYYGNERITQTIKEWENDDTYNPSFGCSAFCARAAYDSTNFIGRVYDFLHYYPKADGTFGGAGCSNIMIHTSKNIEKTLSMNRLVLLML